MDTLFFTSCFERISLVYIRHWSLLVASLQILSADSITPQEMSTASALLLEFYRKCPELYGMHVTIVLAYNNVHCCCEMHYECSSSVTCVSVCATVGPVMVIITHSGARYSCFSYESRNADVKRLFHGSRDMSKQVNHVTTVQQYYMYMVPYL